MIKFNLILLILLAAATLSSGQSKKWTLQECIDYGVEKSLQMERQLLVNKRDNMNLRDAVLDLLPSVSGSTSIGYNFGRSIGEDNVYTNTRNMSNSYSVGASLNLFSGFTAVNSLRYNRITRLQGLEYSEKKANDIAVDVMRIFYDLAYAEGLITIAQEQIRNAQIQLKKMERQHELGIKPKSDLFDIQAQLAESEFNLISNTNTRNTAMISLKQAMNYDPDAELEIDIASMGGVLPENSNININDVFLKAKGDLPEILASEYNMKANRLNWYVSKGRLLPSISMSGNLNTAYYDTRDESFSSQFNNNVGKGFGFSMQIPIFSGLNRHANASRAKYQMQDAELAYKEDLQILYKEIRLAVQDLQAASQEYVMALKKENFSTLSYDANKKKYEQGMVTIIDLNTSDNNLLKAKHDVLKARLTYGIKKRLVDFYMGTPLQSRIQH